MNVVHQAFDGFENGFEEIDDQPEEAQKAQAVAVPCLHAPVGGDFLDRPAYPRVEQDVHGDKRDGRESEGLAPVSPFKGNKSQAKKVQTAGLTTNRTK